MPVKGLIECTSHIAIRHIIGEAFEQELAELDVSIVSTPQPFGGLRRWFVCPKPDCRRRCAVLYLAEEGLACRVCAKLRYRSQRMRPNARMRRRAERIFRKLNVDTSQLPHVRGPVPKGMKWPKYLRLYQLACQLETRVLLSLAGPRVAALVSKQ
jgi:hypothetical protein